jgi:hypothetical protein
MTYLEGRHEGKVARQRARAACTFANAGAVTREKEKEKEKEKEPVRESCSQFAESECVNAWEADWDCSDTVIRVRE